MVDLNIVAEAKREGDCMGRLHVLRSCIQGASIPISLIRSLISWLYYGLTSMVKMKQELELELKLG